MKVVDKFGVQIKVFPFKNIDWRRDGSTSTDKIVFFDNNNKSLR